MPKIIHTGDIHLDSAFTSLSTESARIRRANLRELFSMIIDIANTESVDAIICAGDLFDAYPIRPETADSLLRDLSRAKMPVFLSPGNHDPYTQNSPYMTLPFPENVHIFKTSHLSSFELPDIGLRIFGAAYTSEKFDDRILADFRVPDDGFTNIISLHSNLYTEGYSPVSAEEISKTGADYIALAHVHKPTEILKESGTSYAYCGCLEARDFGEQYDTGIYIGEVRKGFVNLSRRSISDVRYREVVVDAGKTPNIISALPTPTSREALRLILTGECETIDINALKEALSSRYFELEVTDKTTIPRDIWQGIGEDSLRGVFLGKMLELLNSADNDADKERILLATRFGIDAIENRDV